MNERTAIIWFEWMISLRMARPVLGMWFCRNHRTEEWVPGAAELGGTSCKLMPDGTLVAYKSREGTTCVIVPDRDRCFLFFHRNYMNDPAREVFLVQRG